MSYPQPSARYPPQQSYGSSASRDPRGGSWQQQSNGYQNGAQQDWVEDNYGGQYDNYANSQDQYAADSYQDQNNPEEYSRFDQGHGGYGGYPDSRSREPRHRSKDPNRHHRPPPGSYPSQRPMNGDRDRGPRQRPPRGYPPNGGPPTMHGHGHGPRPPRDHRAQRPPGAAPPDRRGYPGGPSPGEQGSWDNHSSRWPGKQDQGRDRQPGGMSGDRAGYDGRPNQGRNEYGGGYADPRRPAEEDPSRSPPTFMDQQPPRPSTAQGVTSRAPPPQRLDIPQHSQTQPPTPIGDTFGQVQSAGGFNSASWQGPHSAAPGGSSSSLPLRPGTAPSGPDQAYGVNGVRSASPEEMPAFDKSPTGGVQPDLLHSNGGSKSEYVPYSPQDSHQRANTFDTAGTAQEAAYAVSRNAAGPYGRPGGPPNPRNGPPPQQGRPPLTRIATDGPQYGDGARAPGPRPGPPPNQKDSQGYGMNGGQFNDQANGQPRNSPRPGPDRRNVDRPNFYPISQNGSITPRPQGAPPQANGQAYPPAPNNSSSNNRADGARQAPGPQSGPPHPPAKNDADPDALPHHPSPVRPGLAQDGPGSDRQKPPPVRQYNNDGRSAPAADKSGKRRSSPVTPSEISELRDQVSKNPADKKLRLKLAKKLSEASVVLADDGGRADARMKAHNRDRFNKEGFQIVKNLADGEYTDGMFYLAECYGDGSLGVQPNAKEAFLLYQSAAKLGHPGAAYRTAVCCEIGAEEGGGTRQDIQKAVQWYKHAANLGDIPATYKIGIILLKGLLGQPKSPVDAVNCLQRAADNANEENPHAVHELALLYESADTTFVPRDEAYALQLFTRAGKLGYKFSQFRLGQAYEYGLLGCDVDARNSIVWYSKAAAQGEHQSELALSGWYLTGSEGILEHNDTEAYLWARKAATADPPLPKAMFAMGYFTEVGIGCPRSLEEAKKWYGKSAMNKYPKAQERIDELRRGGSKVQKSREKISRANQKQNEENCVVM